MSNLIISPDSPEASNILKPNKAPIVVPNKDELGDKRLDPKENLAKLKEGNKKLAAKNKIPDQARFEDLKEALGRIMMWNDLVRVLQDMNPLIIIQDGGMPNAIAVRYTVKGDPLHYVTGFMKMPLPEFSAVITDDRGVATMEVRGWRQVILALIGAGALTVEQVKKKFGTSEVGTRRERWENVATIEQEKKPNE